MPFRSDLAAGLPGIRWSIPDDFETAKDERHLAVVRDPHRKVSWLVRTYPWRFDLRAAFDGVLRADLEADARHLFEKAYKPPTESPIPDRGPRTADPRWSPIVEVERVHVGAAPALRVVRRLTYQPGSELLSGELIVPLANGFAEIAALARASTTGWRESVLMLQRSPGPSAESGQDFPSQAEMDDPKHDAVFEKHPLSLVRAAQRWLLAEPGIEVTKPFAEPPLGEQELEAPGCAVTPPPRFLFVPREALRMSPTLASFTRVGIGEAPVRLVDVWRLAERISGRDRAQALRDLALETTAAWQNEGVTDLEQEAEVIGVDKPQAAVSSFARYKVGESAKISAMRWRADEDGTVFRVCAGAERYVPESELREQADEVMASLRRLDTSDTPAGIREKPWWKLW